MKLLYDETFGENRTTWHLLEASDLDQLYSKLDEVLAYLRSNINNNCSTHIFYTNIVSTDAIEDSVRTSILIRQDNHKFDYNINTSDFLYTTQYDKLGKIKLYLEESLI